MVNKDLQKSNIQFIHRIGRSAIEPKYYSKCSKCSFPSTQALAPVINSTVYTMPLQRLSINRCLSSATF